MTEDGFLGCIDDNLNEPFKSVNWKETYKVENQMDYWKLVLKHNYNCVESIEEEYTKKAIYKSIEAIEELTQVNCGVTV